jgi:tetratricopeptide (TPR) repeat protein
MLKPIFLSCSLLAMPVSLLAQAPAAPAAPAAGPAVAAAYTGPPGRLIYKDKEIRWGDVTMTGSNIGWKTKNPQTGGDMILNITAKDISRVDFPEPEELQQALIALSRNEVEKAVQLAQPVVDKFAPFKTTPGTYYPAASMVQLEAMAIKRDPGYEKLRGDIKTINLNSADEARLKAVDATYDYVKGILGPALTNVTNLIPTVDDGSVLAKLWLLRGDIQFKRGNFADALEAYLHVPVFYGAQAAYLPNAELGAARSLQKMGRLEDAVEAFRTFKERYVGMPQAVEAGKEMEVVSKALGMVPDPSAEAAPAESAAPAAPAEEKK